MRRGSHLMTGAVLAGLGVAALAVPAPAQPAQAGAAPERRTELEAVATARATGQRVAVADQRTETQEVFANPSGTLTLVQHTLPVRVRRGDGWVPVDTTLSVHRDGSVRPAATAVPMAFSGGGTGPLARVSAQGREFGLGWPAALPSPELAANTATYRDVLPGVDLVVTADVLGFGEVLVVKTREAARNPALRALRLTTHLSGLTATVDAAGNIDASADGETVFHAGTPLMWDSGPAPEPSTAAAAAGAAGERLTGPPSGGRHAAMRTAIAGDGLVIEPDQALLADPGTRFPVFLDPSVRFAGARLAWTSVWKAHPTSSYFNSSDIARVGHENQTGMTNRSFFRMNTSTVRGKHIIRGTFRTYETHSWSCSARNVEVWRTGGISASTTWNNQPAWSARLATVNVAKGYNSSCPDGGVDFNVTAGVVTAAASNWSNLTLGLRATSETDTYAWKKFRNNPTLEVEYNSVPNVPTERTTDPGLPCVIGAGRPVVGTATPTIRARLSDPDAHPVGARFEWWPTGGSGAIGSRATTKVASGQIHQATVTAGHFVNGGTYSWRVRAEDGTDNSAWAGWCELTVDTSAPTQTPAVTSADYPPTPPGQDPVYRGGIGVSGSFTLSPGTGDTDVTGYVYGLNQFPPSTVVAANATTKTASVTLAPTVDLLNTLYLRSRDAAGNLGPIYGYQFHVRPVTFPVGHWALDETAGTAATDRADPAHPATASGGVSWTTGRVGGGARLNGTDASLGTAAPVLRTDAPFTVAAWVRLTDTTASRTAVSQDGARNSRFALRYDAAAGRWCLQLSTVDSDTETLHRVLSTQAPRPHVWTHLAGVYDKAAGQIRLYVDGVLQGSLAHPNAWQATGGTQLGRARWHGAATEYWAGDLDDVRVHQGVLPAATVAGLANPPAALAGHWRLDETAGLSAVDSSGAGRGATVSGAATWEPGWSDGSLTLDGTGGSAATAAPVVRTDQSFTVAAWLRLGATPEARRYTAVSQDGAATSGFLLQYVPGAERWGITMPASDSATAATVTALSTTAPAPEVWTHVAGVYDASAGQLRLYVDGVLAAVVAHSGAWHAGGPLQIGRAKAQPGVGDWWSGGIDDVRVYQGALSDDEIYQLTVE